MNALSTLTIDELKQGREDTFSDEMLRAIDAELACREQAQAADNNALMTEAAQKIDRLAAENARLRSLLAALVEAAQSYRNLETGDDELDTAIEAAKEAI